MMLHKCELSEESGGGWRGILLVFAEHEDAKGAKGIEAGDLLNLVVIKVEKDQTLQAVKKPKGQKWDQRKTKIIKA